MKQFFLVLITMATGCGSLNDPVNSKKFREEKNERLSCREMLRNSETTASKQSEYLQNAYISNGRLWTWQTILYADFDDYEAARRECLDIGFDLPTQEDLDAAVNDEGLRLLFNDEGTKPTVFIRNQPDRLALRLACIR